MRWRVGGLVVLLLIAGAAWVYYAAIYAPPSGTPAPLLEPLEEYRPLLHGHRLLDKEDFQQLSPWQAYVTPYAADVRTYVLQLSSAEDVYRAAVSWVWVSDAVLHGQDEYWMKPAAFIADTPSMPSNPTGRMASDCEEQAYTLVSLLRALGVSADEVRVVVGAVECDPGQQSGHAWVEIWYKGAWMALEATSGPYWDEEGTRCRERQGAPYLYYLTHRYPVNEVWGYFNDRYYYHPETGEGTAPPSWKESYS